MSTANPNTSTASVHPSQTHADAIAEGDAIADDFARAEAANIGDAGQTHTGETPVPPALYRVDFREGDGDRAGCWIVRNPNGELLAVIGPGESSRHFACTMAARCNRELEVRRMIGMDTGGTTKRVPPGPPPPPQPPLENYETPLGVLGGAPAAADPVCACGARASAHAASGTAAGAAVGLNTTRRVVVPTEGRKIAANAAAVQTEVQRLLHTHLRRFDAGHVSTLVLPWIQQAFANARAMGLMELSVDVRLEECRRRASFKLKFSLGGVDADGVEKSVTVDLATVPAIREGSAHAERGGTQRPAEASVKGGA